MARWSEALGLDPGSRAHTGLRVPALVRAQSGGNRSTFLPHTVVPPPSLKSSGKCPRVRVHTNTHTQVTCFEQVPLGRDTSPAPFITSRPVWVLVRLPRHTPGPDDAGGLGSRVAGDPARPAAPGAARLPAREPRSGPKVGKLEERDEHAAGVTPV